MCLMNDLSVIKGISMMSVTEVLYGMSDYNVWMNRVSCCAKHDNYVVIV